MKCLKAIPFLIILVSSLQSIGQQLPVDIHDALEADDSTKLSQSVNLGNVNECYQYYSLLSHTIRYNTPNCFTFLLNNGADVNLICNDYVPPIMHAAKYGRLDMLKQLVAKGADVNYKYKGDLPDVKGMTPLTYAEKFNQKEVANYLRTITK